ncbi:MAG: hypothetical protein H6821_12130 [Planctomycetaceae bacterium]|nr:hypothetical protein [Planctomycetaceae bacterium]
MAAKLPGDQYIPFRLCWCCRSFARMQESIGCVALPPRHQQHAERGAATCAGRFAGEAWGQKLDAASTGPNSSAANDKGSFWLVMAMC